jgi:hypothetical protein
VLTAVHSIIVVALSWNALLARGDDLVKCLRNITRSVGNAISDYRLTRSVTRAARAGETPKEVESLVGQTATINTVRDDKDILEGANIEITGMKVADFLDEAKQFVYWVRPGDSMPLRIIGVYWGKSNSKKLFTGCIYNPSG